MKNLPHHKGMESHAYINVKKKSGISNPTENRMELAIFIDYKIKDSKCDLFKKK